MEETAMRSQFEEGIRKLLVNKRADNKAYLSIQEYQTRLAEVKAAQVALETKGVEKNVKHYRLVRKYNILTIDGSERLIRVDAKTGNILLYVTNEELFDILHETHHCIGHGGRNRMKTELQKKYSNITKDSIMVYLRLCEYCQEKISYRKRTTLISTSSQLNPFLDFDLSRAQLDFIDMQSHYNDYRYVMVHEDHSTKFVVLKPLKSKSAEEITNHLLDIYTIFRAPIILHSVSEKKLIASVITKIRSMWDDVKIVNGNPAHSRRTDLAQIKNMIDAWMEEKKTKNWVTALKFVQFQKNGAIHSDTNRTPYEAMFGCPAEIQIPKDILDKIHEEDDLAAVLGNVKEERMDDSSNDESSSSNIESVMDVKPVIEDLRVYDTTKSEMMDIRGYKRCYETLDEETRKMGKYTDRT